MREQCLVYLKDCFLNGPTPEGSTRKPTEEEWNGMPQTHKDWIIDLVLGFGKGSPLLDKIIIEANKRAHSDLSLGMEVRNLIRLNS